MSVNNSLITKQHDRPFISMCRPCARGHTCLRRGVHACLWEERWVAGRAGGCRLELGLRGGCLPPYVWITCFIFFVCMHTKFCIVPVLLPRWISAPVYLNYTSMSKRITNRRRASVGRAHSVWVFALCRIIWMKVLHHNLLWIFIPVNLALPCLLFSIFFFSPSVFSMAKRVWWQIAINRRKACKCSEETNVQPCV